MVTGAEITIRTAVFSDGKVEPSDVQALVDLGNAVYIALGDERRNTPEEVRMNLEAPDFDAAHDTFIAEQGGQVIGYADLDFHPATGRGWSMFLLHPDHWDDALGRELLRRVEARCLERGAVECPPEMALRVHRNAVDSDHKSIALFEATGYEHIRTFNQMKMELDHPMDAPPLPEGLTLRPVELARDAYAIYQADQDAFADHWGFEGNTFEEIDHYYFHHPKADPSLWLIAYDGDEIAGFCLNRRFGDEDPSMGWVWDLGVRRPWRKRGLGSALLRRSLALFQERGFTRAALGVDSDSLTNALALYERVGMRVYKRTRIYCKYVRESKSQH